jgi:predicted amidophosphoribosyltransferase
MYILKFNDCNSYLKYPITSTATNYSVCNKCARFCKFKPNYCLYCCSSFNKIMSVCLYFLRNGLTIKEAGLILMEAGLISLASSGEHDVYFEV